MDRSSLPLVLGLALGLMPPAVAGASWNYTVGLAPGDARLTVAACSARPQPEVRFLAASRRAPAALREPRRDSGGDLARQGYRLAARDWRAGECLRYSVDLATAAAGGRRDAIRTAAGYWLVSPTRWLWRPDGLSPDSTLRLDLPPGWSASLPWPPLPGRPETHRLGATPATWPALTAFGRFEETPLALPGGRLRIAVLPSGDRAADAALRDWLANTGPQLLGAYGRLPLPDTQVLVVPLPGATSPAPWAEVTRGGGSAIHLYAGTSASRAARAADWTLTHELAHLLHPWLGGRGRWLGEGLGSYYQNVLRARAGTLAPAEAWRRLDAGFARGRRGTPQDAPPLIEASGGRGSTMRLYWSGAAFWLEADLALRERGDSLDAVLDRFARRHLPSERRWSPEQFVAALDALIGAPLLAPRLQRYAGARDFPDLSATYARLGLVRDARGALRLEDTPASAVRAAIMAPPAQSKTTPGKPST